MTLTHNVYSQFGEDIQVSDLLDRVGVTNRWCFEVGAADGLFISNTRYWRDQGWSVVLIEPDEKAFKKLWKLQSPTTYTLPDRITEDVTLDNVLSQTPIPADLDFGVLDIDGEDYWAWEDMVRYRPRVMLVEHQPTQTRFRNFMPTKRGDSQVPLGPIVELGKRKGYTLVDTTQCNALFCLTELLNGNGQEGTVKESS